MNIDPFQRTELPPQVASRAIELLENRIGLVYITQGLTIQSASALGAALSEFEANEIEGQFIADAFLEFFGCDSDLESILNGSMPFLEIKDINRTTEDGEAGFYDFTIYPASDQSADLGLILVIEEKTEEGMLKQNIIQQRNELKLLQYKLTQSNGQLHQLNHLKSVFLSMAAHDLRTPLSIITAYADMLTDAEELGASNEKVDPIATNILEQSLWLNTLIDGILDLQLIENGTFPMSPSTIDIRDTIHNIISIYQPILTTRGINLTSALPAEEVLIDGDPSRIKQIAYNLIGNSCKFIGEDGIVEVNLERDLEKNVARLLFKDNGPGIEKSQQANIFEIFYRTKKGKRTQGTGLGLFIVKTIVDAHQGTIRVESEPGVGTTFIIEIPLIQIQQSRDEA